jgi:hypothetical protein
MTTSKERAIFERIWREPAYIELHRAKDAISPFSAMPNTPERIERLRRFDAACVAIVAYETAAGIKACERDSMGPGGIK